MSKLCRICKDTHGCKVLEFYNRNDKKSDKKMKQKIRFYTYPPIEHPWVLRNLRQKARPYAQHEIVDVGVYELLKEPYYYSDKTLQKFEDCKTDGWKTVPDYPDIFKEHGYEKDEIDNVALSKALMKTYYDPTDETHLPVIQGYYDDPWSFDEYGEWFLKHYPEPKKIGVGTVCKGSKRREMKKTLSIARQKFPNAFIHAFGLSIRYLDEMRGTIDSFDSTAWTFPRTSGRPSCKNKEMRIAYFKEYLEIVKYKTVEYNKLEAYQY